jgi:hypothetical protein
MIKPRSIFEKEDETDRTTVRIPRTEAGFRGWGPRLRY